MSASFLKHIKLMPVFFLFFSISSAPIVLANDMEIYSLLKTIEAQKFSWMGFQAKINLNFYTADGNQASCNGALTYMRLSEKIKLECFGQNNQTLFVFKTLDIDFELYLPGQKKLYRGNIFDLEDADDFHSHIKPLDLYRAIKPLPIAKEDVTIETDANGLKKLYIWRHKNGITFVERQALVNPYGHVTQELFFDEHNSLLKEIYRENFRETPANEDLSEAVSFPNKISITETKTGQKTEFVFLELAFVRSDSEAIWKIDIHPNTEILMLPGIEPTPKRHSYFT